VSWSRAWLYLSEKKWLYLDEVWETLLSVNPNITRSSIYQTFCRNEINRITQKAKKFKEYEPGFLHIYVTYLPKFEG